MIISSTPSMGVILQRWISKTQLHSLAFAHRLPLITIIQPSSLTSLLHAHHLLTVWFHNSQLLPPILLLSTSAYYSLASYKRADTRIFLQRCDTPQARAKQETVSHERAHACVIGAEKGTCRDTVVRPESGSGCGCGVSNGEISSRSIYVAIVGAVYAARPLQ
jgi:hypothetical protein